MDIQTLPLEDINPAPYNPRKDLAPGDPEYEKLRRSIESFGCVELPVWNRRTGHLVGGHQRFKILRSRGDREVRVVVVDLPLAQEKALNKIGGGWEQDKLAALLADLVTVPELDVTVTGFDGAEVERLMADLHDGGLLGRDEDDDLRHGEPVTQPGDLIVLGRDGEHRLLCGDVTHPPDVDKALGDFRGKVAACHTDPPYGVRYNPLNRPRKSARGKGEVDGVGSDVASTTSCSQLIRNDDLTPKQYAKWFPLVAYAIAEALLPGGAFYIWNAHRQFGLMHEVLTARKLKVSSTIVWAKESFSPGFGDYNEQVEFCLYGFKGGARHKWYGPRNASTLWRVNRDRPSKRGFSAGKPLHSTQKPFELAERAIRNSSKRGEVVFDPFMGSGTTLLAAAYTGRRSAGLEIDPRHCDTVVRRYIAMVGESAVPPEVAERYRITGEGVVA